MNHEAIIVQGDAIVGETTQEVERSLVARLSRQLQGLSVKSIHHVSSQGEAQIQQTLQGIRAAMNSDTSVLILESTVAMDSTILQQIIEKKTDDSLVVSRPLESKFSDLGMAEMQCGESLKRKELPIGIYVLSDNEFSRLVDSLNDMADGSLSATIHSLLLRQRARFRCIESRNSEVAMRPISGPAIREQVPRMLEIGETTVTKRATNGRDKLRAEVGWLRALPDSAKPLFTEVLDAQLEGDIVGYTMPRYKMSNLEESLHGGEIAPEKVGDVLFTLFSQLAEKLYPTRSGDPVPGYIRFKYLEKIKQRTAAAAALSPLFQRFANAESIQVNGKNLPGLSVFLRSLGEDIVFLASMEPPHMHPIHGDLKPDNILVGDDVLQMKCIDPMGVGLEDTALDGAKPLSTFTAYHHAFKKGGMRIELAESDGFKIDTSFLRDNSADNGVVAACETAMQRIAHLPFYAADERWLPRVKLHSALIQLAFASYHLIATEGKEERVAVGLLGRGLEMLEEIYPVEKTAISRGRLCNYKYEGDRPLINKMLAE